MFFTKNCQKLHILLVGEFINELTTLYYTLRSIETILYTRLYKTIQYYIQRYTRLYNTIIRLYDTIQHCTMNRYLIYTR